MRQEIIQLYDEYTHERLDRRIFMDRLAKMAGGTAAAAALLPALQANYAKAAIVPADDPRLQTEQVTFAGATGEVRGYLARPSDAAGALPGVVVIHENRGLNPHIEDVTRRMALEGFVALAPDFLSPQGGTPQDEDQAREMIRQLDQQQTIQNALAAVDFLEGQEATTDRVGVTGFCWGGALANEVAVNSANIDAVVPFYGRAARSPRFRRRCFCTTPVWTIASTPGSPTTSRRSRTPAWTIRSTSTRGSITPSTTTPRRSATIRRRRSSPGRVPSTS